MRDLTDYFSTPTKKAEVKVSKKNKSCSSEIIAAETHITSEEKSAKEVTVLSDIENSRKEKSKNVHNKKKKKKRKPSDPIVNNITEMLSSNLSIISPSNSFEKAAEVVGRLEHNKIETYKKIKHKRKRKRGDVPMSSIKEKDTEEDSKNDSTYLSPKKSFVVESETSQSSSIQPELEKNEYSLDFKSKVNAFELMMESRNKSIGQNSPGKELQEDERSNDNKAYKEKLSVRTSLLQDWAKKKGASKRKREEEERDEIINHKLKKRAKRLKKLLKANEYVKVDDESTDVIIKKRKFKVIVSSSESSKDSVEILEGSKDILGSPVLDTVEENAQDEVMKCSKSKRNKQGLLSFFGILNRSEKYNQNKNEGSKEINPFKVKTFNAKEKNATSGLSLKKREIEAEVVTEESEQEQSTVIKKVKKSDAKNLKESSQKFSKRKSQIIETPERKIADENDDSLTPRSLRTWKMKIKLNTEDSEQKKKDNKSNKRPVRTKRNMSSTYREFVTDESSNEGKIKPLRIKKLPKTESEEIVSESDDDFIENKRPKRHSAKPLKVDTDEIILSHSDDEARETSLAKKAVKVAPVFLKATPKPKLAPEVLEARKQFLMSGIPSSLKKNMEKQKSMEEREYDIFPSISHVQQKCESVFWKLTKPDLSLKTYLPLKIDHSDSCSGLNTSHISNKLDIHPEIKKVDNLKTLLNKIKADNPDYPVYKSFKVIYEKSGKMPQQEKNPKQKRKKKSINDDIEIIEPDVQDADLIEHTMWTEKYKPKCTDDIIGNTDSIKTVKKWLQAWIQFSQEITRKNKRRQDSTSESEFDTTDCDSRDSTRLPGNTIVLGGPCGSGKSTAIYAICKELGYNVIELNASSKRTGKRLVQELQEATQSHQVRKSDKSMHNFLQSKTHNDKAESQEQQREKKMCVLLIEDIDVVFEQDDGFISALTQLVTTSKRPIIMTTTDPSSAFAQRFISQYEYISFLRMSSRMLATWLQIVCLVEGLFVNRNDIGCLLEFNMGDVRKTLLELQFWVQSGGQLTRDEIPVKIENTRSSTEEKHLDDEAPPAFIKDQKKNRKDCTFVHSNCIGSFEIFRDYKPYSVPYHLNLGLLWWNMPNIIGIPNFSTFRLSRFVEKTSNTDIKDLEKKAKEHQVTLEDKIKLNSIERLYDSLALTDVMFRKVNYFDGTEPNVKNFSSNIKDSLELAERVDTYDGHLDFIHQVTHSLVNGCIEEYNAIEGQKSKLNMAVPGRAERRWRAKHHVCEDVFQEALSLSSYVERKSVALDYMPSLRNISRSECRRAVNNMKRRNRFRNYLRDLNINYNDGTLKLACNILMMNDEL